MTALRITAASALLAFIIAAIAYMGANQPQLLCDHSTGDNCVRGYPIKPERWK